MAGIYSVIIKHPKTSCKLSKTIIKVETISKVACGKSSKSPLYSERKKK